MSRRSCLPGAGDASVTRLGGSRSSLAHGHERRLVDNDRKGIDQDRRPWRRLGDDDLNREGGTGPAGHVHDLEPLPTAVVQHRTDGVGGVSPTRWPRKSYLPYSAAPRDVPCPGLPPRSRSGWPPTALPPPPRPVPSSPRRCPRTSAPARMVGRPLHPRSRAEPPASCAARSQARRAGRRSCSAPRPAC
jgi:hypothetical protein